MVTKTALILLFLLSILSVEAQRDNRRRSGRRKPTTEIPPPVEEPEEESNSPKSDSETNSVAKPANVQPAEAETSAPTLPKETDGNNAGGPPFIVPRGTRKPRPMQVRGSGESKPRPTLPTFARKSPGRIPKPERHDFKKTDENQLASSSTSTTTSKPFRNSSRRRNNSQSSDKIATNSEKSSQAGEDSETSTETTPKKRFGGGRRQSPRGNRRSSPAVEET